MIVTTTSSRAIRSSSADLAVGRDDPGATVVAVLVDDLGELVAHDGALALRLGQDVFEVGDLGLDLGQVVDDALAFQCGQPAQLHVEDRLCLDFVDVEQLDQARRARSSTVSDARISAITSSSASSALTRPRRMWARSLALRSR